jgi:protein-tyrosine-phosphatase
MTKGKVRIIFVCVENARRSQMAQGFAEVLGQANLEVFSAGSHPASQIDPLVVEVMKEKGIDLSAKRPMGLNDLPPFEMDYLVTMGCEETCPAVSAKKVLEWTIPDPKGRSVDEIRKIRDKVEVSVRKLLEGVDP